ncbi:hypothetical protein D3C78_1195500 [compost metagenome]
MLKKLRFTADSHNALGAEAAARLEQEWQTEACDQGGVVLLKRTVDGAGHASRQQLLVETPLVLAQSDQGRFVEQRQGSGAADLLHVVDPVIHIDLDARDQHVDAVTAQGVQQPVQVLRCRSRRGLFENIAKCGCDRVVVDGRADQKTVLSGLAQCAQNAVTNDTAGAGNQNSFHRSPILLATSRPSPSSKPMDGYIPMVRYRVSS